MAATRRLVAAVAAAAAVLAGARADPEAEKAAFLAAQPMVVPAEPVVSKHFSDLAVPYFGYLDGEAPELETDEPPSFVEAGAGARAPFVPPQGWAVANGLEPLRTAARGATSVTTLQPALKPVCDNTFPVIGGGVFPAVPAHCRMYNGWIYAFDAAGRPLGAAGTPTAQGGQSTTEYQLTYVRTYGHMWDVAGHLRANSMGGHRDAINMWPQGAASNTMGRWRVMERAVEAAMAANCGAIQVRILFTYAGAGQLRPSGGRYYAKAAGAAANCVPLNAWTYLAFKNSECGALGE